MVQQMTPGDPNTVDLSTLPLELQQDICHIQSGFFVIDFDLINKFENLRHLRIDCYIEGGDSDSDTDTGFDIDPGFDIESAPYTETRIPLEARAKAVALPKSLESLWIGISRRLDIWLVVWLSLGLPQNGRLKCVRCVTNENRRTSWDEMHRIFAEEGVRENFEDASVELEMRVEMEYGIDSLLFN
ncbi:hypothetical protein G7Z17_g8961 [Cylindrodendrum hubeiense]|uniref:Uncharacterized protein n=1 Tax=Cylindrodendrum hubeiense TaxID=595255 RepID=A0A9P5H2I2_9HYPO|nr:hypothetical protein G7Z17_g8961 [Cylindrodendrum hubeiense]